MYRVCLCCESLNIMMIVDSVLRSPLIVIVLLYCIALKSPFFMCCESVNVSGDHIDSVMHILVRILSMRTCCHCRQY